MLTFGDAISRGRWAYWQGAQGAVGWKLGAVMGMVEPSRPTDVFPAVAIFHTRTPITCRRGHVLEEKFGKIEFRSY